MWDRIYAQEIRIGRNVLNSGLMREIITLMDMEQKHSIGLI
jgi:hypothetical protein